MAIEFSCPRCDRRYSVSDGLAGKRVVCRECGQERTVPGQVATAAAAPAKPRPAPMPPPPPASRPSPPRPPARREEVIDEFDEVEDEPEAFDDEEDYRPPEIQAPPPPSRRPPASRRRVERSPASDMNLGLIVGGFFGLLAVVFVVGISLAFSGVLEFGVHFVYYGWFFLATCGGMVLVGEICLFMVAFNEDASQGMLFFLPPYQLYFVATRWDETKNPFAIAFTGMATLLSPIFLALALPALSGAGLSGSQYARAEVVYTDYCQRSRSSIRSSQGSATRTRPEPARARSTPRWRRSGASRIASAGSAC